MAIVIRAADVSDIPDIVQLQAIVWQDHFYKERNVRVPVMLRTARNMEYYMEAGGCFVALDGRKVVGSIVSHVWGNVGWFGPLEVNPVCQGKGIGKALVAASLDFLRAGGCRTIGCETMAGSAHNIAFYNKLGFRSRCLSNVLFKRLGPESAGATPTRGLGASEGADPDRCREVWERIQPGLDYRMELDRTRRRGLGKVWSLDTPRGQAHAIVHTYEMFEGSQNAIIKLIAAGKGDYAAAAELLAKCEGTAEAAGKTGMFLRTYDPTPPELGWFFERGYELQGASVRLIRDGPDESGEQIHVSCWSG